MTHETESPEDIAEAVADMLSNWRHNNPMPLRRDDGLEYVQPYRAESVDDWGNAMPRSLKQMEWDAEKDPFSTAWERAYVEGRK